MFSLISRLKLVKTVSTSLRFTDRICNVRIAIHCLYQVISSSLINLLISFMGSWEKIYKGNLMNRKPFIFMFIVEWNTNEFLNISFRNTVPHCNKN